jgi:hypothetical protein
MLTNLWLKILSKLGIVGAFIPSIAAEIKFALKAQDCATVQIKAVQLQELAASLSVFAELALQATADGNLTLVEGSELALALEAAISEAVDIVQQAEV